MVPAFPVRAEEDAQALRLLEKALLGASSPALSVSRLSCVDTTADPFGRLSFPLVLSTLLLKCSQEALFVSLGTAWLGQAPHFPSQLGSVPTLAVSPLNCLMTLIECVLAMCRALRLLCSCPLQTEPASCFLKSLRSVRSPRAT